MLKKDVYTCKDHDCMDNCNGFCMSNEKEECKRDPKTEKKEYPY